MISQVKINEIVMWLRKIYGDKPAVIAVSGGVDSAVALTLLVKALGKEKVTPLCLPYGTQDMTDAKLIIEFNGVLGRMITINIGEMTDATANLLQAEESSVRKGNIMARSRMIILFDTAKRLGALVCGTENKSEHHLGYFTRFGDSASDVEPISGLYKTEVWEVAKALKIPEIFLTKEPSAGLWTGQTDENEMGFSYQDADRVLTGDIEGMDSDLVARVNGMVEKNRFKLVVPYMME